VWLLGLLSNYLGIFIGGTVAWIFKGLQSKINTIYALCAGLILGLICMEIFPEAVKLGGWLVSIIWVIVGMLSFGLLHQTFNYQHSINTSNTKMYLQTGLVLLFSISLHNFPMGILIGTSLDGDIKNSVIQTLLFHSIPEGIILFTPFILSGIKYIVMLVVSLLVSLPVALGVYVGSFIGSDYWIISTSLISFTVGIILMVTITEILLPTLKKSSVLSITLFTILGILLIGLYLRII